MGLIASATGIVRPKNVVGSRVNGALYAFDEAIVVSWFKGTWGQENAGRRAEKPAALLGLDALRPSSVAVDDVVSRSDLGAWVLPKKDIAGVVLARSKYWGVAIGASVIKIESVPECKPFYASRDATEPISELLHAALGERFEKRRG